MAGKSVVQVLITGDAKGLGQASDEASKSLGGLSDTAKKVGAAIAAAFAVDKIVDFAKDSVAAYTESAKAQAALTTALENSTATVGVTAKAFGEYNAALAKKVLADDDAIASGEAVLARFNLTEKELKALVPVMLDVAATLGTDLPTAADLMGKALLGNTRALKQLGIEFKPTGDKAKDLATIQELLAEKTKGAAQAQFDAAGPGEKLRKSMDELQESVGGLLVPALEKLSEVAVKVTDWFTNLSGPGKAAVTVVGAMAAAVLALNVAEKLWTATTEALAVAQLALDAALSLNPIGALVISIGLLVAAFVLAWQHCETFRTIVTTAFNAVKAAAEFAFTAIRDVVLGTFNFIRDHWQTILEVLTGPIGLAVGVITNHWDKIKAAFSAVVDAIGDLVGKIVGFFTALPGRLAGAAGDLFGWIWRSLDDAVGRMWGLVQNVVGWFGKLPGWMAGAAGDLFGWMFRQLDDTVGRLWGLVQNVVGWFAQLPGWIGNISGDLFGGLFRALDDTVVRMWGLVQNVVGWFAKLPDWIENAAGSLFGWMFRHLDAAVVAMWGMLQNVIGWFSRIPGWMAAAAGNMFGFIKDEFVDVVLWLWGKIWDIIGWFGRARGWIANEAVGMWDGITEAFKGALNWIIRAWNSIEFTLPSVHVPGTPWDIGGFTLGTPDILEFAKGGDVPGPIGMAQLAIVHGGEEIIPANRRGSRGGINIGTLNVQAPAGVTDARAWARAVAEELRAELRRGGNLGFTDAA